MRATEFLTESSSGSDIEKISKHGVAEVVKMPPTVNSSQGMANWAYQDARDKKVASKGSLQGIPSEIYDMGDHLRVFVLDAQGPVLYLALNKFLDGFKSGAVAVEPRGRGKNLAVQVYQAASNTFGRPIYSDTTQTDASRIGIWQKLVTSLPGRVVGYDQRTQEDLPLTATDQGPAVRGNQPVYTQRTVKDLPKPVTGQNRSRTRLLKLLPNQQGVTENADQAAVAALQKKHGWSTGTTVNGDLYFTWQGLAYEFYGERVRINWPNGQSVSVVWGKKPDWQGRGNDEVSFAQAVQRKLLKFDLSIWQQLDRRQINDSQALQKFKAENERQARQAIAQGVTEGREEFNQDMMQPGFEFEQEMAGITYKVINDSGVVMVTAWDPEGNSIGHAVFSKHQTRSGLESLSTDVNTKWHGKGIAANMYAIVRMLGANINPSLFQTKQGKNMWKKWQQQGDVAHLKRMNTNIKDQDVAENFADGKVKGKSRPGRVKRAGASCSGSVTDLRQRAKNASGERARMYHWCANMKSGHKK